MRRTVSRAPACLAALAALGLAGCFGDSPPPDFAPLPGRTSDPAEYRCPELDGQTYDLAGTPLAAALFDRQAPATHGLPVVLSFRQAVTQLDAWWVVPRESLREFAARLRASDPERYAHWRELVLRGSYGGSRAWDYEGYLRELGTLGPPGPIYAGRVTYLCKDGWTRGRDQGLRHAGERITEEEVWIARDSSGDLLVRRRVWRLHAFSSWGGNVGHWRSGSDSTWSRVAAIAPESADKLRDEDLPPAPAETYADSADCSALPGRLAAFSQAVQQALPTGVELSRFLPENSGQRPRHCRSITLELAVDAAGAAELTAVDAILRAQPGVHSLDLLPTEAAPRGARRRWQVVLGP